jgi:hypothetical protein
LAIRGPAIEHETEAGESLEQQQHGPTGMRLILYAALFVVLPALLLAGWLWARNWMLYDDFTATNQFIRIAGGDREYSVGQVIGESGGLWLSLYAVFGWFNLRPPHWVYWFWNGIIILAFVGAVGHWLQGLRSRSQDKQEMHRHRGFSERIVFVLRQRWVLPVLLAAWVGLVYASLVMFLLQTEAAQGRLLFPALVPLALGVAYGLTVVKTLRRLSAVIPPAALLVTLYCLLFVIRPAYARPLSLTVLPPDVVRLDAQLGQGLTLAGAVMETETAAAGDEVWMTLYWQSQGAIDEAPEYAVSIFGRNLTELAKLHSYHGRGMYPANLWDPGAVVADRFAVRLDDEVEAPTLGRVRVSVVDGDLDSQAGEIKIIPESWPESDVQEMARIGDVISLLSAEIDLPLARAGDTIGVDVRWRVLQAPGIDLTTMLHIGPADQAPLAVGDRPPLNGDYPTRIWEAGEIIDDSYNITLPADMEAGQYPLWLGLYDSETIARWPLAVDGQAQPHHVYLVGWIEVAE